MKRIEGAKYIGELPKVLVQAPMEQLSRYTGICGGCKNVVHFLNADTMICPLCAGWESSTKQTI